MRNGFYLPLWLGFCILATVAAFFLWQEHRAHILGAPPYLLLLLCPLSHRLMHRLTAEKDTETEAVMNQGEEVPACGLWPLAFINSAVGKQRNAPNGATGLVTHRILKIKFWCNACIR
jgi:hypothetical protein